ncbi:FBP domain-containing protein [Pseudokineococcus sp. 5B2Z-1]|uniref:FBP domain-containing protein n=1 Tax=Pseudokineococcus sp. 5B2Z-1 TaxID=3132744 RepID=UPI0030B3B604
MLPLTPAQIRSSFVGASRKELADMSPPPELDTLDWDRLDVLGWRDAKLPRRSYVVVPVDSRPVGLLLLQASAAPRRRAQCAWCQDVELPADVVLRSARRAGAAGRAGDTVGTLVCEGFECSANVRRTPPLPYEGFDLEAARVERVAGLQARAAGFARAVLATS